MNQNVDKKNKILRHAFTLDTSKNIMFQKKKNITNCLSVEKSAAEDKEGNLMCFVLIKSVSPLD